MSPSPKTPHRPYVKVSRGGYPATLPDILRAQNQGYHALMANQPASTCPYKADSERGRFLALMWFRGWRTGRERALESAESPAAEPHAIAHPHPAAASAGATADTASSTPSH